MEENIRELKEYIETLERIIYKLTRTPCFDQEEMDTIDWIENNVRVVSNVIS